MMKIGCATGLYAEQRRLLSRCSGKIIACRLIQVWYSLERAIEMSQRTAKILIPVLLVPLLCIILGLSIWIMRPAPEVARPSTVRPAIAVAESNAAVSSAAQPADAAFAAEQARIALYERVGPAVVSIDTSNVADNETADSEELQLAQGSGFLVATEGYIVTNNHVIEDARSIYVTFMDGNQVPATLVGRDEDSDLAVIKVDAAAVAGVEPISFADSRLVKVGQDTVAIGNPFGLQNTMTRGIVSAVEGRSLPSRRTSSGNRFQISRIIQTDAAINPGNSGGPLLDSRGNLIGINTAIRVVDDATTPSFAGIGYAVPSNTIRVVVDDLIATGEHKSAYLGISMLSVTPQFANSYELPVTQGVLISDVVADGPADKAGLTLGSKVVDFGGAPLAIDSDIVVAFNGEIVRSSDDLIAFINDSRVGDTVTLTVQRGGKQTDVLVTLGERPK
jgi:2-alkenal reductase